MGGAVGSGGGWGLKEWIVMGGEGNRVEGNRIIAMDFIFRSKCITIVCRPFLRPDPQRELKHSPRTHRSIGIVGGQRMNTPSQHSLSVVMAFCDWEGGKGYVKSGEKWEGGQVGRAENVSKTIIVNGLQVKMHPKTFGRRWIISSL